MAPPRVRAAGFTSLSANCARAATSPSLLALLLLLLGVSFAAGDGGACDGGALLATSNGSLVAGPAAGAGLDCSWRVAPPVGSGFLTSASAQPWISVVVHSFATAFDDDALFVSDGATGAPLAAWSGALPTPFAARFRGAASLLLSFATKPGAAVGRLNASFHTDGCGAASGCGSRGGRCVDGLCACPPGWSGAGCELAVAQLIPPPFDESSPAPPPPPPASAARVGSAGGTLPAPSDASAPSIAYFSVLVPPRDEADASIVPPSLRVEMTWRRSSTAPAPPIPGDGGGGGGGGGGGDVAASPAAASSTSSFAAPSPLLLFLNASSPASTATAFRTSADDGTCVPAGLGCGWAVSSGAAAVASAAAAPSSTPPPTTVTVEFAGGRFVDYRLRGLSFPSVAGGGSGSGIGRVSPPVFSRLPPLPSFSLATASDSASHAARSPLHSLTISPGAADGRGSGGGGTIALPPGEYRFAVANAPRSAAFLPPFFSALSIRDGAIDASTAPGLGGATAGLDFSITTVLSSSRNDLCPRNCSSGGSFGSGACVGGACACATRPLAPPPQPHGNSTLSDSGDAAGGGGGGSVFAFAGDGCEFPVTPLEFEPTSSPSSSSSAAASAVAEATGTGAPGGFAHFFLPLQPADANAALSLELAWPEAPAARPILLATRAMPAPPPSPPSSSAAAAPPAPPASSDANAASPPGGGRPPALSPPIESSDCVVFGHGLGPWGEQRCSVAPAFVADWQAPPPPSLGSPSGGGDGIEGSSGGGLLLLADQGEALQTMYLSAEDRLPPLQAAAAAAAAAGGRNVSAAMANGTVAPPQPPPPVAPLPPLAGIYAAVYFPTSSPDPVPFLFRAVLQYPAGSTDGGAASSDGAAAPPPNGTQGGAAAAAVKPPPPAARQPSCPFDCLGRGACAPPPPFASRAVAGTPGVLAGACLCAGWVPDSAAAAFPPPSSSAGSDGGGGGGGGGNVSDVAAFPAPPAPPPPPLGSNAYGGLFCQNGATPLPLIPPPPASPGAPPPLPPRPQHLLSLNASVRVGGWAYFFFDAPADGSGVASVRVAPAPPSPAFADPSSGLPPPVVLAKAGSPPRTSPLVLSASVALPNGTSPASSNASSNASSPSASPPSASSAGGGVSAGGALGAASNIRLDFSSLIPPASRISALSFDGLEVAASSPSSARGACVALVIDGGVAGAACPAVRGGALAAASAPLAPSVAISSWDSQRLPWARDLAGSIPLSGVTSATGAIWLEFFSLPATLSSPSSSSSSVASAVPAATPHPADASPDAVEWGSGGNFTLRFSIAVDRGYDAADAAGLYCGGRDCPPGVPRDMRFAVSPGDERWFVGVFQPASPAAGRAAGRAVAPAGAAPQPPPDLVRFSLSAAFAPTAAQPPGATVAAPAPAPSPAPALPPSPPVCFSSPPSSSTSSSPAAASADASSSAPKATTSDACAPTGVCGAASAPFCTCNVGFFGPSCGTRAMPLAPDGGVATGTVAPGRFAYFSIAPPPSSAAGGGGGGSVVLTLRQNATPAAVSTSSAAGGGGGAFGLGAADAGGGGGAVRVYARAGALPVVCSATGDDDLTSSLASASSASSALPSVLEASGCRTAADAVDAAATSPGQAGGVSTRVLVLPSASVASSSSPFAPFIGTSPSNALARARASSSGLLLIAVSNPVTSLAPQAFSLSSSLSTSPPCPGDGGGCSSHGTCSAAAPPGTPTAAAAPGRCVCDPGWAGAGCESPVFSLDGSGYSQRAPPLSPAPAPGNNSQHARLPPPAFVLNGTSAVQPGAAVFATFTVNCTDRSLLVVATLSATDGLTVATEEAASGAAPAPASATPVDDAPPPPPADGGDAPAAPAGFGRDDAAAAAADTAAGAGQPPPFLLGLRRGGMPSLAARAFDEAAYPTPPPSGTGSAVISLPLARPGSYGIELRVPPSSQSQLPAFTLAVFLPPSRLPNPSNNCTAAADALTLTLAPLRSDISGDAGAVTLLGPASGSVSPSNRLQDSPADVYEALVAPQWCGDPATGASCTLGTSNSAGRGPPRPDGRPGLVNLSARIEVAFSTPAVAAAASFGQGSNASRNGGGGGAAAAAAPFFYYAGDPRKHFGAPSGGARPPMYVTTGGGASWDLEACVAPLRNTPGSMMGAWCLVVRGGCTFAAKAVACQSAGAVGVLVVDNDPSVEYPPNTLLVDPTSLVTPVPITIPTLAITLADGARVLRWLLPVGHTFDATDSSGPAFTSDATASASVGVCAPPHDGTCGGCAPGKAAPRDGCSRAACPTGVAGFSGGGGGSSLPRFPPLPTAAAAAFFSGVVCSGHGAGGPNGDGCDASAPPPLRCSCAAGWGGNACDTPLAMPPPPPPPPPPLLSPAAPAGGGGGGAAVGNDTVASDAAAAAIREGTLHRDDTGLSGQAGASADPATHDGGGGRGGLSTAGVAGVAVAAVVTSALLCVGAAGLARRRARQAPTRHVQLADVW